MYVLLDDEGNVLIEEMDLVSGGSIDRFVKPEKIRVINSYRNKDARVKTFFPWYSFKNKYHLVKKSKWLRSIKGNIALS
ncbi:hypothetical protein [Ligilactobacillus cholophilus]|uniref:hypothetical protein n=1 Tax=Ligilactobacillus cholophilus TaxID=3050131 RepID=UPI0025B03E03|nr:hypothetical protein [Ligilactobacillus cholophilus]